MINRLRSSKGVSLIETLVVLVILAALLAVGLPKLMGTAQQQGVRNAKANLRTMVAVARAASVQRGCRSTLNVQSSGRVWVTACRVFGAGGTLDTVGDIRDFHAQFGVTVNPGADSINFDPRGLKTNYNTVAFRFVYGPVSDSIVVNALGKVIR